jgi:toxin ParE1/3/4
MPWLSIQPRADDDVTRIVSRIAQDNLAAALKAYDAAEHAFKFLAENPGAGPEVEPPIPEFPGLRFWPITPYRNYLVLYSKLADGVQIVRVLHGARDLSSAMKQP